MSGPSTSREEITGAGALRWVAPLALLLGCERAAPPPTVVVGPAATGMEGASDEAGDARPRRRLAGSAARPPTTPAEGCCPPGDPLCTSDVLCPPPRPAALPPAPASTPVPLPAAAAPAPPGALVVPTARTFAVATDQLTPDADQVLQAVADELHRRPEITLLRIEGHTDALGHAGANLVLSTRRSLAVARWLVAHGVDCTRLLPVGFGSSRPVVAEVTEQDRAANRRIVLVRAALHGKVLGGAPVDGGGRVAGDPCR